MTPLAELLDRNRERLDGGPILFEGLTRADISALRSRDVDCAAAHLVCRRWAEYVACSRAVDGWQFTSVAFGIDAAPDAACGRALIALPQSRAAQAMVFHRITSRLHPPQELLVIGATRAGIRPAKKLLATLFASVETVDHARRHALLAARDPRPTAALRAAASDWENLYEVAIGDTALTVCSLPGVFSHGRLDAGTRLLLESLEDEPAPSVLDLACGCGVVGAWLAARKPGRSIVWADDHASAVTAARRTADLNQLDPGQVIASDVYSDVTGRFDLIACNPPFHQGVDTEYDIAGRIISGAANHLTEEGRLRIVANRFLPYRDRLARSFKATRVVRENNRYRVYESRGAL
jgi:16S rRNA (guanine1207-N2)-methyltransferase